MLPKPGSLNTEPGEVPLLPGALVPPGPSKAWQLWFGGPVPLGLEAAIALAALPRPMRPVRTSVVTIRRIRPPMGRRAWSHVSPRSCPLLRVDAQNRSACQPGRSDHYSVPASQRLDPRRVSYGRASCRCCQMPRCRWKSSRGWLVIARPPFTETVYCKQLRPVIEGGADVMDRIFPAW